MSSVKNKFYVTTPIYYVTAKPHLGHLYSTVIADVLARWHRLKGQRVQFLTGTDEYGQKIAQAAQKAGMEPQKFVDSFIDAYKNVWKDYEVDYTIFMRTTYPFHTEAVQKWLKLLMEKGDIYKSHYQGWYCVPDETFVTEQEVSQEAPVCPSCGRKTEWVSEEAYFFKLSAYQDRLLAFYEKNPDFIIPKERTSEVINFVKSGLRDLSISRTTVKWGVPFPDDTHHVTYVWADALNNYITAIGWGQKGKEKEFTSWWPADVQVMGKDILRFHAVYWPAFLMASDTALPKHLLVHGWFKVGTQKMSKSLGNVIDPVALYKTYGADQVRYYLMRQMAITHDGEFTVEDLEQKISSDLADDLGNLLNRMIALAQKYNCTSIAAPQEWIKPSQELFQESVAIISEFQTSMNECMFHMALSRLWRYIKQTNAYFHAQEPWKIAQKNPHLFNEILSATAHSLYTVGILLWPVMPKKMEQLLAALGEVLPSAVNLSDEATFSWNRSFGLHTTEPLFTKPIEKKQEAEPSLSSAAEVPSYISIDQFAEVDLRVGQIQQCTAIEKSDKLYKLEVDFGEYGIRQILSGIRKHFSPEELIGQQALFVTNLPPRKMMGLDSQGMLLTAETTEKKLALMRPTVPVANGTKLK